MGPGRDASERIYIRWRRAADWGDSASGLTPHGSLGSLRERLAADLSQVTYIGGESAFLVRDCKPKEAARGGDLTVVVRQMGVTRQLEVQGTVIEDAVTKLAEITGTHDANTEGIFLAAGPDIDPEADLGRIHTLDITPTLLYALALPVAQDFDGQPRLDVFNREFRSRHPVRTIRSWGPRDPAAAATSEADADLMEELRALGYLD